MLSPSPAPPAPARPLATGSDVSIMISRLGRGGDWDGERWPAPRQGVLGPPRGCEGGCRSQGGGPPPCPLLPVLAASSPHACPCLAHVCTHACAHACGSAPRPLAVSRPRGAAAPVTGGCPIVPVSPVLLPSPPGHWQGSGCHSRQLPVLAAGWPSSPRHGTAHAPGRLCLSRYRGQPVSHSGSELLLEPGGEQQRGEPHACAKSPMCRHTCGVPRACTCGQGRAPVPLARFCCASHAPLHV